MRTHCHAYVAKSSINGFGVFAARSLSVGSFIEVGITIPVSFDSIDVYRLAWTDDMDCIATGCLLMYNHSDEPNVSLVRDIENRTITVVALRDIVKDEELTFRYACGPWW